MVPQVVPLRHYQKQLEERILIPKKIPPQPVIHNDNFGVPVGDQIPERIFEALEMSEITGWNNKGRTRDLRRDRPAASPLI